MSYVVILYYRYVPITDPQAERDVQRQICQELRLKGRILVGSEGINGTVAGARADIAQYRAYMEAHPLFSGIAYKVETAPTMPFPKLQVKSRPEIVTLGAPVDMADTADHVSPEQFNDMIQDPNVVLFDARNNYESAIGRFKGAVTPDINVFSKLPDALDGYEDLKERTIIAYCTGGIRCEKASALMKRRGFNNVYQLDGGIIAYAQAYPNGAFEGECFVFDDRMSTAFTDTPAKLGRCETCSAPTNRYINCSLKSCNKLFLTCDMCRERQTACSKACLATVAA